jgi:hypothetical protein
MSLRGHLPLSLLDHPDSLAQCEPCLGVLTAGGFIGLAAHDEIGRPGDDALNAVRAPTGLAAQRRE